MAQYPELEFYRFDGACSIVTHVLFRELDIPFKEVRTGPDLENGGSMMSTNRDFDQEDYKKRVHYNGYTPGLLVDGKPLTEMTAMMSYLVSLSSKGEGLDGGEDPFKRAQVVSWNTWFSGTMHGHGGGYGMLYRPQRFVDDEKLHPVVQEKARQLIVKNYKRIEEHLADREYFVGSTLTLPDYYSIIFWLWGNKMGFEMKTNYPNFGRLIKRLESRKAVREVLEKEGQKFSYDE